MKKLVLVALVLSLSGCVTTQPLIWSPISSDRESEYDIYLKEGKGRVSGQAFLTQRGGGVVKAAGRTVTLDPATSMGTEWWSKAGRLWFHREKTPNSPAFMKARRTVVADSDGRFIFKKVPAGDYFIRTEVTWVVGKYNNQGGLVGKKIAVGSEDETEVILNALTK